MYCDLECMSTTAGTDCECAHHDPNELIPLYDTNSDGMLDVNEFFDTYWDITDKLVDWSDNDEGDKDEGDNDEGDKDDGDNDEGDKDDGDQDQDGDDQD